MESNEEVKMCSLNQTVGVLHELRLTLYLTGEVYFKRIVPNLLKYKATYSSPERIASCTGGGALVHSLIHTDFQILFKKSDSDPFFRPLHNFFDRTVGMTGFPVNRREKEETPFFIHRQVRDIHSR